MVWPGPADMSNQPYSWVSLSPAGDREAIGSLAIGGPPNVAATIPYHGLEGDQIYFTHIGASALRRAIRDATPATRPYITYDWQVTHEPVNQIPHLFDPEWGALMAHACTFAHHIAANYNPHAWMLADGDQYDMLPLTPHTSASNDRNRVVLRYARTLVGLVYDRLEYWERLPAETPAHYVGTNLDWRHRMTRLQDLDEYICSVCGANEFWPREMLFKLGPVADWITAFDRYTQAEGSVNYTVGLPKIIKGTTWTPSTELVADSSVNLGSLRSHNFWKGAVRDFKAAVARWDTDPRVRFDPSAH